MCSVQKRQHTVGFWDHFCGKRVPAAADFTRCRQCVWFSAAPRRRRTAAVRQARLCSPSCKQQAPALWRHHFAQIGWRLRWQAWHPIFILNYSYSTLSIYSGRIGCVICSDKRMWYIWSPPGSYLFTHDHWTLVHLIVRCKSCWNSLAQEYVVDVVKLLLIPLSSFSIQYFFLTASA